MKQSYKNFALFMALALTAAPALAGVAHGGSPLASTDEHAELAAGSSPTADKTVEVQPVAGAVNIQPKAQADGTLAADPDANAKLRASTNLNGNHAKSDTASADNGGAAMAPGSTPGAGGRVKLESGAKDGSAK